MTSQQSSSGGQDQPASDLSATIAANMDEHAAVFQFEESPGFGSRLRAVREARGLSIDTVAHTLRLPVRVLQQLERGDFAMDSQVYLDGYIRKYARYLDIDDSEIEAELGRLKPTEPPLIATGGISHSRYLFERYATAATYVVLTMVIAVPTIWLGVRGTLTHDMSHLAPLDAAPVAQQDAPAPTTPATAASNVAAIVAKVASLPASAASTHSEQQPLMASMVPVPNMDSDTPSVTAPDPSAAATVGEGSHSLTLNLASSSWVEITNKAGTRLEYGLLPAGTVKTFRSDQALEVRIGNASGAQINLDGQSMPLDTYRHSNVAHFRIEIQDGKAIPAGA